MRHCVRALGRGVLGALHAVGLGAGMLAWAGTGGDTCIPERERARIEAALAANIAQLSADRGLAAPLGPMVQLQWPLRQAAGFDDPGYHHISGFVDHDPDTNGSHILDYDCGTRTYDTPSYNHRGTDFLLWPARWLKMQNNQVEVVAAAAGTIVLKQDGFFDESCNCDGASGNANTIHVRHVDGSVAWYVHMKKLSLTAKTVGQTVAAGEYLGRVGSSGCSTSPHLHFELHLANGALQDPFAGPCNTMNPNSWWLEQRPYADSAINKLTVGYMFPTDPECPEPENLAEWSTFGMGQTVYFTTYFRDAVTGQVATYRLLRPDGTPYQTFDYVVPEHPVSEPHTHVKAHARQFSVTDPPGLWRLEVDYLSEHHSLEFSLVDAPGGGTAELTGVAKAYNGVALNWTNACPLQQGRGGIAIGTLGSWYSHTMWWCDYTGGAGLIPWHHLPAAHYFLVVPQNTLAEGSYGQDSAGNERPPGAEICLPQQLGCN